MNIYCIFVLNEIAGKGTPGSPHFFLVSYISKDIQCVVFLICECRYFLPIPLQVNPPSLMRPGSAEQYKRAFARQRARDLAQHADALLSKDKEIAALQQECRELEAQVGTRTVLITQFLTDRFTQPTSPYVHPFNAAHACHSLIMPILSLPSAG